MPSAPPSRHNMWYLIIGLIASFTRLTSYPDEFTDSVRDQFLHLIDLINQDDRIAENFGEEMDLFTDSYKISPDEVCIIEDDQLAIMSAWTFGYMVSVWKLWIRSITTQTDSKVFEYFRQLTQLLKCMASPDYPDKMTFQELRRLEVARDVVKNHEKFDIDTIMMVAIIGPVLDHNMLIIAYGAWIDNSLQKCVSSSYEDHTAQQWQQLLEKVWALRVRASFLISKVIGKYYKLSASDVRDNMYFSSDTPMPAVTIDEEDPVECKNMIMMWRDKTNEILQRCNTYE